MGLFNKQDKLWEKDENLDFSQYRQDQLKYISSGEIWVDKGDHYEQFLQAGENDYRSIGKTIPKSLV